MRRICELEDEPPGAAAPGDFRENGTSGERDLWGSLFPWGIGFPEEDEEDETSGVSVSPIEDDRGRDLEDGTSGVSFIKEAGNGFEGFLEE